MLAHGLARWLDFPQAETDSGLYGTNGILLGLYLGSNFTKPLFLVVLWVSGSFLITLLTRALTNTVGNVFRVPICSTPFVLVTLAFSLLCHSQENSFGVLFHKPFSYSTGYVDEIMGYHVHTPLYNIFIRESILFLKSLGAIIFQHSSFFCILALCAMILHSRFQLILALSGFAVMRIFVSLLPFYSQAHETLLGFNAILIAISLGGYFFVPGKKSFLLMFLAQTAGALLSIWMVTQATPFGGEITALPFNIVIIGTLLMLQNRGFHSKPCQPAISLESPEAIINYYHRYQERIFLRALSLPVFGKWQIVQGFEGKETHKNAWRFGVDFAVVDDAGNRFRTSGIALDDYYTFNAPVRSPVHGVVSQIWDQVPDNAIKEINTQQPWGNYVILYSAGLYIGLYHLKKGSLQVAPGQPVTIGTPLARIGNSGRSALPHLHFQVQVSPHPGAENTPFMFQDVLVHGHEATKYFPFFRPTENVAIHEIEPNDSVKLQFLPGIDTEWVLEITDSHGKIAHQSWKYTYSLIGNVLVTEGTKQIEYAPMSRNVEVVRFLVDPFAPLNLFAFSVADLPYQMIHDVTFDTIFYGKCAFPLLSLRKKILSLTLGDIFAVHARKKISEKADSQDPARKTLSVTTQFSPYGDFKSLSPWKIVADFDLLGFKELTLFKNNQPVKSCRRISAR